MLWYALLIPLIISILAYWKFKAFVWWEIVFPSLASVLFILISYFTIKYVDLKDVEYNGYIIKEARYYEPWETWVHKTCSYTTCTGSGKTRHCTTHHYDCSYCDYTSAKYVAIDDGGHEFSISQTKYNQLVRKWNATPVFHELNRNISYHGSCGKDGDMYSVNWDGKIETSESSVIEVSFSNPVKRSHSAFNYPQITDKQADTIGLYYYPSIYDAYKQPAILGIERFYVPNKNYEKVKFEYLNGSLGKKYKVKVFTLLFHNKPIDIAFKQEAYWDGGNQNEIVVCIGLNDKLGIDWVKPFSWCDNKRIIIDTREDIANLKTLKLDSIYNIYQENIPKYYHFKSFKDFNYLTFEPTTNQILFVWLGTLIISLAFTYWCVVNKIEE